MNPNYIKKLREKNQLTQEYLAAQIGVSRPTYAQIEQGQRGLTVTEAKKMADIFSLALDDFLAEKNLTVNIKPDKKSKNKSNDIRIDIPQEYADKFREVLLYILKKIGRQTQCRYDGFI